MLVTLCARPGCLFSDEQRYSDARKVCTWDLLWFLCVQPAPATRADVRIQHAEAPAHTQALNMVIALCPAKFSNPPGEHAFASSRSPRVLHPSITSTNLPSSDVQSHPKATKRHLCTQSLHRALFHRTDNEALTPETARADTPNHAFTRPCR